MENKQDLKPLNYEVLIENLICFNNTIKDPDCDAVLKILFELTKIFEQMGGAMAMAFADITQKIDIIRKNLKLINEKYEVMGIFSAMNYEIKENIHILNGENWLELGKGDENYKNYESISRTMIRLNRFFYFVLYLLQNLLKDKKSYSSTCCSDAYKRAFEKLHKLYIRVAAKAAMLMAPNRKIILSLIIGNNEDEIKAYEKIEVLAQFLEPVCDTFKNFIEIKKIQNLP